MNAGWLLDLAILLFCSLRATLLIVPSSPFFGMLLLGLALLVSFVRGVKSSFSLPFALTPFSYSSFLRLA